MADEWSQYARSPKPAADEWAKFARPLASPAAEALRLSGLPADMGAPPTAPREVTRVQLLTGKKLPKVVDEAFDQRDKADREENAGLVAIGEGAKDISQGNYSRGGHKIISGGMDAGKGALYAVAPAAPVATAVGLVTGMAGQKGGTKAAEMLGADEDQAALAGDIAGIVTGGAGAKAAAKVPAVVAAVKNSAGSASGVLTHPATREAIGIVSPRVKHALDLASRIKRGIDAMADKPTTPAPEPQSEPPQPQPAPAPKPKRQPPRRLPEGYTRAGTLDPAEGNWTGSTPLPRTGTAADYAPRPVELPPVAGTAAEYAPRPVAVEAPPTPAPQPAPIEAPPLPRQEVIPTPQPAVPAAVEPPAPTAPPAVPHPSSKVVSVSAKTEGVADYKLITEDGMRRYMADNPMPEEQARAALESNGYFVIGRSKLNRSLHGMASELGLDHQALSDAAAIQFKVKSLTQLTQDQMLELYEGLMEKQSASAPLTPKSAAGDAATAAQRLAKALYDEGVTSDQMRTATAADARAMTDALVEKGILRPGEMTEAQSLSLVSKHLKLLEREAKSAATAKK